MALEKIAPYYKAVTGVIVPFLTSVGASMLDTSAGGSAITAHEWVVSAVVGLTAGGAVFAVPNKDPEVKHQDESVQPPDWPTIEREGYVGEHRADNEDRPA